MGGIGSYFSLGTESNAIIYHFIHSNRIFYKIKKKKRIHVSSNTLQLKSQSTKHPKIDDKNTPATVYRGLKSVRNIPSSKHLLKPVSHHNMREQ